jgi:hypothetical protein
MGTRERWKLDPREVSWKAMSTASSGRVKARLSRSLDLRSVQITGEHVPTGLLVTGAIPEGHYSRDQMRKLQDDLRVRLLSELERKVARRIQVVRYPPVR